MSVNPTIMSNFVKALTYFQVSAGKTKKEVADAIGVPATTYSSWSNGKHLPDMDNLQKLANYLNAPVDQFFDFSLDKIADKELANLHQLIDTDDDLVQFLKVFTKLSEKDKHLLTMLLFRFISN